VSVDPELIAAALREVEDPELPVGITDLGMVRGTAVDEDLVTVDLAPTFLACPALWMVEADVRRAVQAVPGVRECQVRWLPGGWSGADVTPAGRRALAGVGLAVPEPDGSVRCPHCGSDAVEDTSPFGSAVCRTAAYCGRCRTPIEVLKTKRPPSANQRRAIPLTKMS
jgi:ring-1,2-phenylacetyl-CoA epoxidase subunit PaaD